MQTNCQTLKQSQLVRRHTKTVHKNSRQVQTNFTDKVQRNSSNPNQFKDTPRQFTKGHNFFKTIGQSTLVEASQKFNTSSSQLYANKLSNPLVVNKSKEVHNKFKPTVQTPQ